MLSGQDPLVSVVILTWNRKDDLLETIGEVKRSTYRHLEIIVVDNGSTDDTLQVVSTLHPDIVLLPQKDNRGIAGYNVGLKAAKGDYIVILDSDSFPAPRTIEGMVAAFEGDETLGAVAFDIYSYDSRDSVSDIPLGGFGIEVTAYNGAGVGIRREALERAGFLYEPFFLYMNELEHSLRILDSGYKIELLPSLIAFHKQSPVGRSREKTAYYYVRNHLWLVWKLYPTDLMILETIKLFYYASFYTLMHGYPVYWKAVLEAISKLGEIFKDRQPIKRDIILKGRIPTKFGFTFYR